MKTSLSILFLLFVLLAACSSDDTDSPDDENICIQESFEYNQESGCDGQTYNDPNTSPYVLPLAEGQKFTTGLTNCSSSYHAAGNADQYAFDFDLPEGTPFYAARGGTVVKVEESQPSSGGGVGNYLVIDHGDSTYGLYYHSPMNKIIPQEGDQVAQKQQLGDIGQSGLAGYPHLHFIVVQGSYEFPYTGMPVSFKNARPADVILQSYSEYEACQ